MKQLNKEQQAAVDHTDGPLLILAGAGTGKTTVITEKIAHLIESGKAKPEEILALTFTDNAAAEMMERVDERLTLGYTEMAISTFHSFCQDILGEHGLAVGVSNQSRLLTETDAWLLMRKHLYDFELDYYRPRGNPGRHISTLLRHFSECKDQLISPSAYMAYAEECNDATDMEPEEVQRITELATSYQKYNQLLLDASAFDFGDLIYYTVKLLEDRPNIQTQIQQKYKYILVDEFQDVNWAQYYMVKLLATPVMGSEQDDSPKVQLTVVGDDDQSIYAFRGASVSNILRFTDDFTDAETIVLTDNYRSGQEILDVAYNSIQNNNPDRLEQKLNINKQLTASGAIQKAEVQHLHLNTLDDEVFATVAEIERLKKETDCTWDDIAVLVRAGNHASPFLDALDKARVPFEFLSSRGLYREPIVLDAINFFRLLDNVKESSSVYRMLRLPCFELPQNDIQKFTFAAKKKSMSYYEMLKLTRQFHLSEAATNVSEKVLGLIHNGVKQCDTLRPTVTLYHFFKDSGYFDYIAAEESKGNARIVHDIHQLKKFFRYIEQFEQANPGADVREFMEHFDAVLESGDTGALYQPTDTPDSVNIMTVHGSKGLEYKYVFVVNMVDDRFPTRRRGGTIDIPTALIHETLPEGDEHYEEERRLFYVAATRAKEKLYLMSAENYGGVRKKKISRFLHELKEVMTIHDSPLTQTVSEGEYITMQTQTEEKQPVPYELPKSFSFSQINSFRKCPYLYKLDHILKIPTAGSHYFSFGNTMHLTLQRFYEQVQTMNSASQESLFEEPKEERDTSIVAVPTLHQTLELYKQAWIPDWYESEMQRRDYKKAGEKMIRKYYAANDGNWTVPIALEGGFKIKIGDYLLRGKIDRIDQTAEGKLRIIDYKTGKPKEKVVGDDKDQLLLYQLVAQSLPEYRNYGEVDHLTFSYLDDTSEVAFKGTDKDLEKLQEKIIKTIDAIYATDWATIGETHSCMWCEGRRV